MTTNSNTTANYPSRYDLEDDTSCDEGWEADQAPATRTGRVTPFDAYELYDAFANVGLDLDEDAVSNDYSGRCMYGARCFSVVVPPSQTVMVGVALAAAAAEHHDSNGDPVDVRETLDEVARLARSARTDDMGRSSVVYFPGWSLPEEG